ncbi:MAG: cell division protein FtsA [Candidatus Pacebacteria bacterium]|nr:cell division protein FtsA [Candidatus Paceibacterota bacterium]
MAKTRTLAAIDIGTEKVCTLIAQVSDGEREPRVVGVASVQSKGMRKSQIVDLDDAIESITESVDAAERMAGSGLRSAFVSLGGAHVESQNSKGVVAVSNPQGEISADDIRRVIEAARAVSLPTAREVLHVIPKNYKVDSQDGIRDPLGMSGVRLECETHIITVSSTAVKNMAKCVNELGVQPEGFVFSGLASSYAVLSETEKELGVVMLDIGAGSTSVCAFVDGSLSYTGVLPIGARHITSDIALGLRISLQSAEKIKLSLSNTAAVDVQPVVGETREQFRERKKKEDELNTANLGLMEEVGPLSRKTVVDGIIMPRLHEMFKLVGEELEKQGLLPLIPAGVVLTGGGAETIGIVEVCKKTLGLSTRVGRPQGLRGLTEEMSYPSFATSAGLLSYGMHLHHMKSNETKESSAYDLFSHLPLKQMMEKLVKAVKSVMP